MRSVIRLDAHHRLFISAAAFIVAFLLCNNRMNASMQLVIAWNAFALIELTLAWLVIVRSHPEDVSRTVRLQDSGRRVITLLVVAASCISLVAVGVELISAKHLSGFAAGLGVGLGVLAVLLSWGVLHTVFALHYAHIYYSRHGKSKDAEATGGLEFPKEQRPDYLDFAYAAFTVGMTWQVSDVVVSSRRFRHIILLHSITSFAFNTIILALAVSIVSGLL